MKSVLIWPALVVEQSPPARGAWIEMPFAPLGMPNLKVAPRTGGVD